MAIALLTLALVGTVALAVSIVLGYAATAATLRGHFLFSLFATTLLVMAHSFIMFFLIATGVELKDMEKAGGWGDGFRRRIIGMKSRAFPAMTLALMLVLANFILGAAAHTRVIPHWAHGVIAWATLAVCLVALAREWRVLGENNRLIDEAARRRGGKASRAEDIGGTPAA